jgi:hypothetical protein
VYGLWVGFLLAVRLDLPEPLAYGLVAAAILAHEKRKNWLSWVLWGLALFAKEVSALFVAAALLSDLIHRRWSGAFGLLLVAVLPYGLFQYWLLLNFGALGISSGGAMATPFELIPLMGFVRIGFYSWLYFLAMLLVFGPAVILPAIWSLWAGFRKIVSGESNLLVLSLLLNALVILFLPFSTFRETGGLLRYAGGLVLSLLLFASRNRMIKVLNYSQLWLVLNVFLLKS